MCTGYWRVCLLCFFVLRSPYLQICGYIARTNYHKYFRLRKSPVKVLLERILKIQMKVSIFFLRGVEYYIWNNSTFYQINSFIFKKYMTKINWIWFWRATSRALTLLMFTYSFQQQRKRNFYVARRGSKCLIFDKIRGLFCYLRSYTLISPPGNG